MPHVADLTGPHPSVAPGAYGWIPDGWVPLVEAALVQVDRVLAADPDVRLAIHDTKEKLGRLAVYASLVPGDGRAELRRRVRDVVAKAEARSVVTCDVCGEPGRLRETAFGWLATRCRAHAEQR